MNDWCVVIIVLQALLLILSGLYSGRLWHERRSARNDAMEEKEQKNYWHPECLKEREALVKVRRCLKDLEDENRRLHDDLGSVQASLAERELVLHQYVGQKERLDAALLEVIDRDKCIGRLDDLLLERDKRISSLQGTARGWMEQSHSLETEVAHLRGQLSGADLINTSLRSDTDRLKAQVETFSRDAGRSRANLKLLSDGVLELAGMCVHGKDHWGG